MSHYKFQLSLAVLLFTAFSSFGQYFNNASNLESVSGALSSAPSVWLNNGNICVTYTATLNPVNHVNGSTTTPVMGTGLNNKPGSGFLVLDSNQNLVQSYAWSPAPSPTSPANDYFFITKVLKGSDGYVYIFGRHAGLVDFDPGPGTDIQGVTGQSNTEGYVIKLSPTGSYMWVKRFSPAPNTSGYMSMLDAMELPNGNIVVVGDFRNTMDFDPGPSTFYLTGPFTAKNGYIMEMDTAANFVSAVKVDGATQFFLGSQPFGGKVIGGFVSDSANIVLNGAAPVWLYDDTLDFANEGYLAAYDASNTLLWHHRFADEYSTYRFESDADHNTYVASTVDDGAVLGDGSVIQSGGSLDLAIEKFDLSGNNVWSRVFQSTSSQGVQSIIAANDAVYLLHNWRDSIYTNTTYNDTSFFDVNQNNNSALSIIDQDSGFHLASYAVNGDSVLYNSYNLQVKGDRVDFAMSLYGPTDLDPGTQTAIYSGPTQYTRHPVYLSWILDPLNFPVAAENEIAERAFDLYPNPGNGNFRIRFENTGENAAAEVYNLQGTLLHETQLAPGGGRMNLSNLPAGMYMLRLRIGDNTMTKRMVIQ